MKRNIKVYEQGKTKVRTLEVADDPDWKKENVSESGRVVRRRRPDEKTE